LDLKHTSGFLKVAALSGCLLVMNGCDGLTASKDAKPTASKAEEKLPSVEVLSVQPSNLRRNITAVGTLRYRRETPLGFTTSGRVARVAFNEGDSVRRGAVLAALDPQNVGADLSVARAEQDRAQADFERLRDLYAQGWVTKKQFEASEAAAKAASARVTQARYTSGTAHIHAPSGGVILSRLVEPGQVVSAGTPAIILGQARQGFVFRVPVVDRDASKLRVGMPGRISIEALDREPLAATISEIDGRANQATGAFTVVFRVPSSPRLRSGQIGTAEIDLPTANDGALQIPSSALFGVRTGEGLVHIVGKDKRIETRNVRIERVLDDAVIVSGALKLGDILVIRGGEKLRAGQKVRPVTSDAAASNGPATDGPAATG